jgi:hypothetical protein
MKTRLFFSLATAAVLFVNTLTANTIEYIYDLGGTRLTISTALAEKAVIVNATNTYNQDIIVTIEDKFGNVMFKDRSNQGSGFAKKYKLNDFEDGEYRLVVVKGTFKTIQPFKVNGNAVEMSKSERKEKFLPNVAVTGNKMDVNVLLGNFSNIHVRLYDNTGDKVFEELNYVVLDLHKRYDLSKLKKGIYFAEVTAGDETQTFTVKL